MHEALRESAAERLSRAHGHQDQARPHQAARPQQQGYLHAVLSHDINFGVGPAGTGKTYLAVACAVEALETDRVRRLLLVRPAVEAGERWASYPVTWRRRSIPICAPSTTRCSRCSASRRSTS
jgi:phosphate starvation-inducible PhoH-like protein